MLYFQAFFIFPPMNNSLHKTLKTKISSGIAITAEDIYALLAYPDKEPLYQLANDTRKFFCGTNFEMCSITNAKSGFCTEDCKWCSQSAHHSCNINTYDLLPFQKIQEAILQLATKKIKRHSLVTSGRTIEGESFEQILSYFRKLHQTTPMKLCASLGLLNKAQLQQLKQAGVSRYHCNIETAPSFFKQLCTTHTIEEKLQTLQWAKETGLEICSGVIIGMGESLDHRLEMAFLLRELQVNSIPINILHPIEGTALADLQPISEDEILIAIALFRLINPKIPIRLAGGRIMIKKFEQKALLAGANAAIVGDLLTTIGSTIDEDIQLFKNTGFKI